MALQLFAFTDRPHDFAVTKANVSLPDCVFLLDFSRPLECLRWLGVLNKSVGLTVALLVPVAHQAEEVGGFVVGIRRGEPYFMDIPKLWKRHAGSRRTMRAPPIGGFELVADFANHFPGDIQ